MISTAVLPAAAPIEDVKDATTVLSEERNSGSIRNDRRYCLGIIRAVTAFELIKPCKL